MKTRKRQSTGDNPNLYMKPGFWNKSDNQFWNKPAHTVIDKNRHVDQVLESSPKAKEYFNEWETRLRDKEVSYRSHQLAATKSL